jgi:pimeloyl-ACP methyl ester carboxylesterase
VALETPVHLQYSRALFYGEMWRTYYGAPVLSLLREIIGRQMWQSWRTGGYRSRHNTAELIDLLRPLEYISRLKEMPILIVYSRRDLVAPPAAALALRQAAPQATLLEAKKASHVTLTLIPEINRQVACWLREQLSEA